MSCCIILASDTVCHLDTPCEVSACCEHCGTFNHLFLADLLGPFTLTAGGTAITSSLDIGDQGNGPNVKGATFYESSSAEKGSFGAIYGWGGAGLDSFGTVGSKRGGSKGKHKRACHENHSQGPVNSRRCQSKTDY